MLQEQAKEVSEGFWLPPLTLGNSAMILRVWLFGDSLHFVDLAILNTAMLASLALLAIVVAVIRPPSWVLFEGIAATPWIAAALFYCATGKSVLHPRYLVLGQTGLFLLFGALADRIAYRRGVPLLACLYLAVVAANGVTDVARTPSDSPPLAKMASWLRDKHRKGDVVIVSSLRELTRVEYLLSRLQIGPLDIRAPISPTRVGHTVHLASLTASNLLHDWESLATDTRRLWHISWSGHSEPCLHGWRLIESREFDSKVSVGCFDLDHS